MAVGPVDDDGESSADDKEEGSHDQHDDVAVGGDEQPQDGYPTLILLLHVQSIYQTVGSSGRARDSSEISTESVLLTASSRLTLSRGHFSTLKLHLLKKALVRTLSRLSMSRKHFGLDVLTQ